MDDDGEVAEQEDVFEGQPDPRDTPKGYARGYIRGATLMYELLERHSFADFEKIYEYCCRYHEHLLKWQSEDGEQDPPEPPPYQ